MDGDVLEMAGEIGGGGCTLRGCRHEEPRDDPNPSRFAGVTFAVDRIALVA